jgi:hypothetical protein
MPQGTLHGHHITTGCDQPGGVEVAQVVQGEALDASPLAGLRASDHPLSYAQVAAGECHRRIAKRRIPEFTTGYLVAQHRQQPIGQEDGSPAAVLRCPDFAMLDLAGDLERAPPEIDITHLDCSGLAQTQPSEGTQSQECAEGLVRSLQ